MLRQKALVVHRYNAECKKLQANLDQRLSLMHKMQDEITDGNAKLNAGGGDNNGNSKLIISSGDAMFTIKTTAQPVEAPDYGGSSSSSDSSDCDDGDVDMHDVTSGDDVAPTKDDVMHEEKGEVGSGKAITNDVPSTPIN